jgi:hypothetical protein
MIRCFYHKAETVNFFYQQLIPRFGNHRPLRILRSENLNQKQFEGYFLSDTSHTYTLTDRSSSRTPRIRQNILAVYRLSADTVPSPCLRILRDLLDTPSGIRNDSSNLCHRVEDLVGGAFCQSVWQLDASRY